MVFKIFNVLSNMFLHIMKRGKGVFKILFMIDDFFRLFTMTIIIPIFFNWIGFGKIMVNLGVVLGLVIDVHDFVTDMGIGKLPTK